MSLHVGVALAVFVDQMSRAPVVQCTQAAPEPTLKWLLPTIVQTVVSLVSVAVGVGIAVWSFRRNRLAENEQWLRNEKAGHEQWIRDQSKAEWRDVLAKIAKIEHEVPILIIGLPTHEQLTTIVLDVLPLLRSTIFIYSELEASGFVAEWQSFAQYVQGPFMDAIKGNLSTELDLSKSDPEFIDHRVELEDRDTKAKIEVRTSLHALIEKLRNLAHESLTIKA